MSESKVANFYANKNVLITGSTGFIGKVLVEKLLRSCPDVKTIYLLLRAKKGMTASERIKSLTNLPIYDNLREKNPECFSKLRLISGDILEEEMGISNDDREELVNNCHIIFHSAACVRFDQKLKDAVDLNTTGTLRVLQLSENMKHLEVLVHLSTAYCRCELPALEEKIYPSQHPPKKIIDMVKWMNGPILDYLEPKLIGQEPNTYAYTKAITESLIAEYAHKFPIAIARPSIVTASLYEPIPGWVDNLNGATGLIVGGGKGVIRTMHCEGSYHSDSMPVDVVVNACILAAHATAIDKPQDIRVYNVTLSGAVKLTWKEILELGKKWVNEYPFEVALWYPGGGIKSYRWLYKIDAWFSHYLPAYTVDALLFLLGKKTFLVKIQDRISHGLNILQYYTTKEWHFLNDNFKSLRLRLNASDDKTFYTDVTGVDPEVYIKNYVLGARYYCCKEHPSTIPKAKKLHKIRYIADRTLRLIFWIFVIWMVYCYGYILMDCLSQVDNTLRAISPFNSIRDVE